MTRAYKKQDPVKRFLKHTERVGDCLLWRGRLRKGLGCFMDDNRSQSCRRWAWVNIGRNGLRDNEVVVMTCGQSTCVNADHMEVIQKGSQRSYYANR